MSTVERYYDSSAQNEWDRLQRHRIEFAITMRALSEHLPPPPARILDIGGGPGRYSIALAKLGYEMTLLDISANELAFARAKAEEEGVTLAQVIHGNALHLAPLPDGYFDAVLLMGPLYHLLKLEERQQAVAEVFRVLKPGGLCAAAFIGRYTAIQEAATRFLDWPQRKPHEVQRLLDTGCLVIEGSTFTDAYCAHPGEVGPLMEGQGFTTRALLATEGLVSFKDQAVNELQGEAWEVWVDLIYRIAADPSILGASAHLLWLGHA